MKKVLFFIVSMLIATAMFAQTAIKKEVESMESNAKIERNTRGISDWGTFTNFTATDMNGVTHNIQEYLDAGKYVAIDFFCAWCGPCWSYHRSGIFESLYETYGQGGTGEFVVLLVECETSNTPAQITGTNANNSYSGASQGDFTNGGTNPVPIIDATSNLAYSVSLYEGYVPSIYLICPAGYTFDLYDNQFGSADAIYNFATSSCPYDNSIPLADINVSDRVVLGQSVSVTSSVFSVSDIISYQWSFDDGSPALATGNRANVVWNTLGNKTITLTVTNEYGSRVVSKEIEVYDCSTAVIDEFPFTEDFEHGEGCWTFVSKNSANKDQLGVYEYSSGAHGVRFSSYSQASNYNQYLISPELDHIGDLTLTFNYALYSTNYQERFKVMYSTTTNAVANFVAVPNTTTDVTSSTFRSFTCTIPAEAKYFAINYCPTSDKWWLFVDDLSVTETIPNYTVTATPDNAEHGTVTGGGSYPLLTDVTLTATAAEGYVFEKWSDDDATNPRVITVTSDVTLTANFVEAASATTYTLTLNVDENSTDMGTVSGAGTYVENASVQIFAIPNTGYHFTAWDDENTDNPRTVEMDADHEYTASFAINQYVITVTSANTAQGTVDGSNTYNYNEVAEISATPAEHYHFLYWNDGNTETPRNITVTENATFRAYFAIDQYTVTTNVDEESHGTVSGAGQYLYNASAVIYAVANRGYAFTQWLDGNTDNPRTVVVTEDLSFTASFEELPQYTITVMANDNEFGTVEGSGSYYEGEVVRIRAIPSTGYEFSQWQEDENTQNPRTITVTEDATYTAMFVPATTAIEDIVASEISIYPNPTTGIVNIEAEGLNKVVVYDVTGRIMKSVANESTIDISNLEAGVYFFSVETANGSAMKKLVKE